MGFKSVIPTGYSAEVSGKIHPACKLHGTTESFLELVTIEEETWIHYKIPKTIQDFMP